MTTGLAVAAVLGLALADPYKPAEQLEPGAPAGKNAEYALSMIETYAHEIAVLGPASERGANLSAAKKDFRRHCLKTGRDDLACGELERQAVERGRTSKRW